MSFGMCNLIAFWSLISMITGYTLLNTTWSVNPLAAMLSSRKNFKICVKGSFKCDKYLLAGCRCHKYEEVWMRKA